MSALGLQPCGREPESELLERAAHPPSQPSGGRGGGGWLPLGTRHFHRSSYWKWNPAVPVAAVGGHQQATGWDECHALACGLVEPWLRPLTDLGKRSQAPGTGAGGGARPRSPFAEETATGHCTTKIHGVRIRLFTSIISFIPATTP